MKKLPKVSQGKWLFALLCNFSVKQERLFVNVDQGMISFICI